MARSPSDPTSKPSRRVVIQGSAAGLALAGLSGCEGDAAPDSDSDSGVGAIDHIVVVMMENRSFDHFLGALRLEEGREEIDGLTGDEVNLDASGAEVRPFRTPEPCQSDLPHGWDSSHRQFNAGACDGFVMAHQRGEGEQSAWAMGYHNREELPVHYALADAYMVPDRFFCSVMGPTWPNRLYGLTGTSEGMRSNDRSLAPFRMRSVFQALTEAGRTWSYFYTDVPFLGFLADHWLPEHVGLLEDFFHRASTGALADFTWIDPGFSWNDDHPPHHPGLGQLFLASVYEALVQSPAWERTLLVITYDEHGGFHDHVAPPTSDDDHIEDGFDQLGFRVPALVIGPWVRQGVDHTVFDNTSVLKYVCERFGLEPWTRRMAAANSLGLLLDTERMARGEPLPPAVLPAFEVPEDELTEDCRYEFRSRRSGQPELDDFIRDNMPEVSRLDDVPDIHRWMMENARRLGLIKP